jgi:NADP-dependent 3-hydroxy acid dehydrogenase YdfG
MVQNYMAAKVILVTGAANGFGRLICEKSAALGARIVAVDINVDALTEMTAAVTSAGGTASAHVADVRKLDEVKAAVAHAVATYGAVDVLINNAGIMPLAFMADHQLAAEAWERCIDINIKGVLHGIIAAHDQMIAQGRGHVVNISSIYGNFPVAGAAVYGATKAAVNFISESLRMESQGKIKVTIIKPTGVPTTGIAAGIVNHGAAVGILAQNAGTYSQRLQSIFMGSPNPGDMDPEDIHYAMLAPEYIADQVVHAINQPWGVSLGDITIRAAGDEFQR